jgi:hypothetical protein
LHGLELQSALQEASKAQIERAKPREITSIDSRILRDRLRANTHQGG